MKLKIGKEYNCLVNYNSNFDSSDLNINDVIYLFNKNLLLIFDR